MSTNNNNNTNWGQSLWNKVKNFDTQKALSTMNQKLTETKNSLKDMTKGAIDLKHNTMNLGKEVAKSVVEVGVSDGVQKRLKSKRKKRRSKSRSRSRSGSKRRSSSPKRRRRRSRSVKRR